MITIRAISYASDITFIDDHQTADITEVYKVSTQFLQKA